MATIWMTYAWDDNQEQDVDFIAQELEARACRSQYIVDCKS